MPGAMVGSLPRGVAGALLVAVFASQLGGCVSLVRSTARAHDLAPNGLSRVDDSLRRSLVVGGFRSAFARTASPKQGAPDDALLRALYRGLTGYYAGELAASIEAFAEADALVERRLTSSVSRGALSLVTNDRALPYVPTRSERLLLRYYAMMARLHADDVDGAAVEARRLGRWLEDATASVSSDERALHAVLRDAAGAVFEAAGEHNDALVSYRNAALLRGATRQQVDSIDLQKPSGDSAALVVFVESGFVAHRVDRGFTIGIAGSRTDTTGGPPPVTEPESSLVHRLGRALDELPGGGVFDQDDGFGRGSRVVSLVEHASTFVRVAWPALRAPRPAPPMRFGLDSAQGVVLEPSGDVSMAVAADLRRDRAAAVARLVVRATSRAAAAEALRDKHGEWAGVLASAAGAALERADTRSWHLLPGAIRVVRLTVPAGTHEPFVEVGDGDLSHRQRLGAVTVRAGETRVLATRAWRDPESFLPPQLRP